MEHKLLRSISFPILLLDALKLSLMNLCYFHNRKSLAETHEMLLEDGDFFVHVKYFFNLEVNFIKKITVF